MDILLRYGTKVNRSQIAAGTAGLWTSLPPTQRKGSAWPRFLPFKHRAEAAPIRGRGMPHQEDNDFQFEGFRAPSYTQVPDEAFDILMARLSPAEFKVMMFMVYRTLG